MPADTVPVTQEQRLLSDREQMVDAQAGCVPCKLCGGKALITDAGVGAGYYIRCENSRKFRRSTGCMIEEQRLGGYAYNVRDWWNKLHASTPSPEAAPAAEVGRITLASLRRDAGMSLREVERAVEGRFSNALLSRLETGKIKRPSAHVLIDLAGVYGVPVNSVFEAAGVNPSYVGDSGTDRLGRPLATLSASPRPAVAREEIAEAVDATFIATGLEVVADDQSGQPLCDYDRRLLRRGAALLHGRTGE